jgi:hypothetical protein
MSWPFVESECPRCRYFAPFDQPVLEDNAFRYKIVGTCLHPRIGMQLFRRQLAEDERGAHCPCFAAKVGKR